MDSGCENDQSNAATPDKGPPPPSVLKHQLSQSARFMLSAQASEDSAYGSLLRNQEAPYRSMSEEGSIDEDDESS